MLELHHALGNVQPQAAALLVPGGFPPDEALHELLGADVQGVPGDVFQGNADLLVHRHHVDVEPGAGLGVLDGVAEKVTHSPPQEPPVGVDVEGLLRLAEQGRQPRGLQLVREFSQGLVHGFHCVDFRQLQGDVAGGCLAELNEIVNEPLHPAGLPGQDLQVLLPVLLAVGLLQKVHIVDDGGQRGLDVVGHVGNELRAHPFGAHLLLGRQLDHVTQAVELHRKVPEGPQHQLVVHLDLQVAPPHPLGSVQKGAEDVGPIEDHRHPGSQEKQHPEAVQAQNGKEQSAPQRAAGEEPLPGQRQQAVGSGQEPRQLFPDPVQKGPGLFHQAQYPLKDRQGNGPEDVIAPGCALPEEVPAPYQPPPAKAGDAMPPPVAARGLELGGAGEAEAHEEQAAQVAAVAVIDKGNGVALAHEIPAPHNADIGIQ